VSMTPERFRQIEELYHAVREGTPEQGAALLEASDPDLRAEVQMLLAQRSGGEFLDRGISQHAAQLLGGRTADTLSPDARLGPYQIESKLGEGGMGEVFRAIDTRLGRPVAIKTMHPDFSAGFEREARAISALNHPNICTLYDVGPDYLVMELVDGETLAARLKAGPLPTGIAIQYGVHILAALAEAHDKGIVHRDLKPGNVMLTKAGAKVLDFGIAMLEGTAIGTDGMVIGTPAYMAPEQRDGKPADTRADIYAFGRVLEEMLAGPRASRHRLRIQSWRLERIINRCLEEDPARRWQSAHELQHALIAVTRSKPVTRTAVAAGTILAVSGTAFFYFHRQQGLAAKDTVVLSEFDNNTGDPVFDETLRQGLAVQLEQSPVITFVSDQQIQQQLRFMNQPAGTRITPEVAREICERTGSAAVLEGSIASVGTQFVLWLRARNCRSGDVLGEEQAQAGRKEEVLNALTRIAVQIRTRLGESLATIQEHSTPLEQATTPSLEALKAFSAARQALFAHGSAAAIPHLQHAIAIDPQFATALGDLSIMYWNMGQTDLAAEYTRKAYELRGRVSDRERRFILFLYDRQVTGNLQTELQNLESWAQAYPRDFVCFSVLAGWGTRGTGQYERGIQAAEASLRLNPDNSLSYDSLALHNMFLDRFSQAADALRRAAARQLEIPDFQVDRYYLAFFNGDEPGMKREVDRARGESGGEDWMAHNQAMVLAHAGQMRQARLMWQRAIELAQQNGDHERAAIYEAAMAACEAVFGNGAAARTDAAAALQLAEGRDVEYAAAFALARSGDLSGSRKLTHDLERRFPEDTAVQFEYLPTLRALAALGHGAPFDAVDQLQTALPYDAALPGTAFFAKFGGLYPAYVRGEAYLQAGRGPEAASEFQKVLDHRGVVFADPIYVLAHLQLARAEASSGDRSSAKHAYEDFFLLWKNADAETPVLQQARMEYATLQ
jgi:tetratricopeptide (TPR) repeat protein